MPQWQTIAIWYIFKAGKTNEFYIQFSTIEDDLRHYRKHFKGKIIVFNTDDMVIDDNEQDCFGDELHQHVSFG